MTSAGGVESTITLTEACAVSDTASRAVAVIVSPPSADASVAVNVSKLIDAAVPLTSTVTGAVPPDTAPVTTTGLRSVAPLPGESIAIAGGDAPEVRVTFTVRVVWLPTASVAITVIALAPITSGGAGRSSSFY